jgi:hypothetical protein
MDIDENKKRKVDSEPEALELEGVLKAYIKSGEDMAKVVAILAQKIMGFEKVFNKDLFARKE